MVIDFDGHLGKCSDHGSVIRVVTSVTVGNTSLRSSVRMDKVDVILVCVGKFVPGIPEPTVFVRLRPQFPIRLPFRRN